MNVRNVLPKDAIPSIDSPTFSRSWQWESDDEVIIVTSNPPKAYPVRILHYHEVVNDRLVIDGSDRHLAVTWCPLCASAIVYDRCVDGSTLSFGVSGVLADDDLVLYDRETESLWKQSTGRCFDGPHTGAALELLAFRMGTIEDFLESHPDGHILQPPHIPSEAASEDDTPAPVEYSLDPYEEYTSREGFGLDAHRNGNTNRSWDRSDLDPKSIVLGIIRSDEALAFPRDRVANHGGLVRTRVGGQSIVVVLPDDHLQAYEDPGGSLELSSGTLRGAGQEWDASTGESLSGGSDLQQVPARRMYAFTWRDDHGPSAFFPREGEVNVADRG